MRKWVILLVVVGAIGAGWYFTRTLYRFVPVWKQPKFGLVTRGDIRVPITAAGLIEPTQRIEIKSEASGEVVEIKVEAGDFVHVGDVLALLNKDDEERNVGRAQDGLDSAGAVLARAKEEVERTKADIEIAKARVEELRAQRESTEYNLKKEGELFERGETSQQQLIEVRSRHNVLEAQLKSGQAQVTSRGNLHKEAQYSVTIQEAAVAEAEKTLEDAQERLKETTIRSRHNAIVTDVKVGVGTLVQSGTQSLTGGTLVMTLADISELKVLTRVDEADYGKVHDVSPLTALPEIEELRQAAAADAETLEKRSGAVKLVVDAFPEDSFVGLIERVEPQGKLNPGASIIQYDVHVLITDEQRFKLPLGAQAQVEFTVESVSDALRVPAEAVKTYEEQRGVWLKTLDGGRPGQPFGKRFVRCRFGITDGAYTQVLEVLDGSALKERDEVYTKLPPEED